MNKSLEIIEALNDLKNDNALLSRKQAHLIYDYVNQLEIADRNNQNLVKTNVDLVNKNLELQKEIKELKEAYINVNEELHCAFARGIDSARFDILEENEKLKKAIEILKQYIQLDLECNTYHEIRMGREMIVISQQEYELLKEVLK